MQAKCKTLYLAQSITLIYGKHILNSVPNNFTGDATNSWCSLVFGVPTASNQIRSVDLS
jgi:hypothetical protein